MNSTVEENVCRLCANRGKKYYSLFDDNNNSIVEKIHNCLPIVIDSSDDLPSHVCNSCIEALEIANRLVIQCLLADSMLRKQLRVVCIGDIMQEKKPFVKTEIEELNTNVQEFDASNEPMNICQVLYENEFLSSDDLLRQGLEQNTDEMSEDVEYCDTYIEIAVNEDPIDTTDDHTPDNDDVSTTCEKKHKTHCEICNITIEDKKLMENHIKFHEPRSMYCPSCQGTFPSPYDLYLHKKTVHMWQPQFPMKWFCERCEKMTNNPEFIYKHMTQCDKTMSQCKFCDRMFAYKSQLKLHLDENHCVDMVDINSAKFDCEFCSKSFICESSYINHLKRHQALKNMTNKCVYCGKCLASRRSLKYHIESFHSGSTYRCTLCTKTFATRKNLQRHQRNHSKRSCNQCGKQFDTSSSLTHHLIKDHGMPAPNLDKYSCKDCGLKFQYLKTFRDHQNIHTGERPYVCDICDKTYRTGGGFYNHKQLHAKSDFYCDYCQKKFSSKRNLAIHVGYHQPQQDWQYDCEICNIKFPNDVLLVQHTEKYRDTHLLTCDVCGMEVLGMHRLKRHKRQKHYILK